MRIGKINLLAIMFLAGSIFLHGSTGQAQNVEARCLFVSTQPEPGHPSDRELIDSLRTWNYDVQVIAQGQLGTAWPKEAIIANFDVMFVSETVSSTGLAILKGVWIPTVTSEMYGSRPKVWGWDASHAHGESPTKSVIIHNADHPLATGFSEGDTVVVASDSKANSVTTFCGLDQDSIAVISGEGVIKIGQSVDVPTDWIVFGVEAGTEYIDIDDTQTPPDTGFHGKTTEFRWAGVGIHENAYDFISPMGYRLIKNAMYWVRGKDVPAKVTEKENAVVKDFVLKQNYPNPFNPITTIEFELLKTGPVTLTVYNSVGQVVDVLLNEKLSAGNYRVKYDALQRPAGLYLYQLRTNNFVSIKKMLLLK